MVGHSQVIRFVDLAARWRRGDRATCRDLEHLTGRTSIKYGCTAEFPVSALSHGHKLRKGPVSPVEAHHGCEVLGLRQAGRRM
jgi:hypothetical protein